MYVARSVDVQGGMTGYGPNINSKSADILLFEGVNLALHVLYGLKVLHGRFGIIHGAISAASIMYSSWFDCWKLCDFSSARPIESAADELCREPSQDGETSSDGASSSSDSQSRQSVSSVGDDSDSDSDGGSGGGGRAPVVDRLSHHHQAPETIKSGLLTTSSDVYALGKTLHKLFVIPLMANLDFDFLDSDYGSECDEKLAKSIKMTITAFQNFEAIVYGMSRANPSQRLTVDGALARLLSFLDQYNLRTFRFKGQDTILAMVRDEFKERPVEIPQKADKFDDEISQKADKFDDEIPLQAIGGNEQKELAH
jgi:serine/threonine protein kinase